MKCLLIVDLQNDFCCGGALEVKDSDKIIPIINNLVKKYEDNQDLIVATLDWHPSNHGSFASNSGGNIGELGELNGIAQIWWPNHCIENTFGSELHNNLKPINNKIYKGRNPKYDSYSGFFDTNGTPTKLNGLLKSNDIDTIDIVGLATDYCVKFTVIDALKLGYKVNLITSGCRGVNLSPTDSEVAIEDMKRLGANIV
ncbi:MAG: bifunctional nicotinamidase/pyrazinamidase [Psychrilyobacter sp.]|nr:bifunctional nicotinamidase/pyrazinamidase [Psychrilyobacter sp.]